MKLGTNFDNLAKIGPKMSKNLPGRKLIKNISFDFALVLKYPEPKMAPKMGGVGQVSLKCITGDLIMMITDKNNIFERFENFPADLAWNYPRESV